MYEIIAFKKWLNVPVTSLSPSVIVRTIVQQSPEIRHYKRAATEQRNLSLTCRLSHMSSQIPEHRGAYREQTIHDISGNIRNNVLHFTDCFDRLFDERDAQLRCDFLEQFKACEMRWIFTASIVKHNHSSQIRH